jgi:hypothetical protein
LAYSLVDSPVGLAAWILEKFYAWSDGDAEITERFSIDELLTNISIYWFSGNVAATLRIYKENAKEPFRFEAEIRAGVVKEVWGNGAGFSLRVDTAGEHGPLPRYRGQ